MLKSSLCDYSNVYVLVKGTIAITRAGNEAAETQRDDRNTAVIFQNCTPFINCKIEINNTEIDNAKRLDIVMLM